jgi:Spy/CpxP family protein refolding chaperone
MAAGTLLATTATNCAQAQDHSQHQNDGVAVSPGAAPPASYAGMITRRVKALSQQQIKDLRGGAGMGLALVAELNGYPGPKHVLELADVLALSDDQRVRVRGLFEAMKGEVVPIGERIIAEETALDGLFAERRATAAAVNAASARIAAAQGELRAAHLRYHLTMLEVLSPDQVAMYQQRRGYATEHDSHH